MKVRFKHVSVSWQQVFIEMIRVHLKYHNRFKKTYRKIKRLLTLVSESDDHKWNQARVFDFFIRAIQQITDTLHKCCSFSSEQESEMLGTDYH